MHKKTEFVKLNYEKKGVNTLQDDLFNDIESVVILTKWEFNSKLDWKNISNKIRTAGWVFDSRLKVNEQEV